MDIICTSFLVVQKGCLSGGCWTMVNHVKEIEWTAIGSSVLDFNMWPFSWKPVTLNIEQLCQQNCTHPVL